MIRTVIGKYGLRIMRDVLCVAVFLIAVLTGGETARIAPFAIAILLLISAGLVFVRETRHFTLPFLLLCLLFIFCYDSFSVFIRYVWVVPIAIGAIVFHVVRLRPKWAWGPTFPPLIAVAVATLLGGVGMISPEEYFRPASIGFMVGLGPALVFSYFILKNTVRSVTDCEMLADDLLRWGLVAAAVVFWHNFPLLIVNGVGQLFLAPQWANNIGTMLMIAMPAPLAVKNRRLYHYGLAFLMFVAGMLSCSRGAQLFIGLEFLVCVFWGWRTERDVIKRLWSRTFFLLTLMGIGYLFAVICMNVRALGFLNPSEARWPLLARGFENFLENPLFGSGFGYLGNADLYNGKQGTINWYHISIAQVVGGLGLCGVVAWGWQLFARVKVALCAWRDTGFGFAICYLGLFLMSLVNPGEFCPVPYAFLAVYFFVVIENVLEEQGIMPAVFPAWFARLHSKRVKKNEKAD